MNQPSESPSPKTCECCFGCLTDPSCCLCFNSHTPSKMTNNNKINNNTTSAAKLSPSNMCAISKSNSPINSDLGSDIINVSHLISQKPFTSNIESLNHNLNECLTIHPSIISDDHSKIVDRPSDFSDSFEACSIAATDICHSLDQSSDTSRVSNDRKKVTIDTITADLVVEVGDANDENEEVAVKQKNIKRCFQCNFKHGILGFPCKCGYVFCVSHRHASSHSCKFDFKEIGLEKLAKQHIKVVPDKIQRF